MRRAELCTNLDSHADRLTMRVLDEMYKNPFWHERFGARADKHGRQDGRFHIDYVIQALQADDPTIMHNYARWLQQVLTSRGMCTRHLAENFERLGAAIREQNWNDGELAVAMLDAARDALHYPPGTAEVVQRAAPSLAAAAADMLYRQHPEWIQRWGEAGRARCLDDLDYHVQYIADALSLGQPQQLASYAVWIARFLEKRNIPRSQVAESLRALSAAAATLIPSVAGDVAQVIETALVALDQARGQ